jgi:hypothetical protein
MLRAKAKVLNLTQEFKRGSSLAGISFTHLGERVCLDQPATSVAKLIYRRAYDETSPKPLNLLYVFLSGVPLGFDSVQGRTDF